MKNDKNIERELLKDKVQWWDISKILSFNCIMNIVESMRGGGKSFGALKFLCNRWKKYNEPFIYFRRFAEDLKFVQTNLFANLEKAGVLLPQEFRLGKDGTIIYNSKGLSGKRKTLDKKLDVVCGLTTSFVDTSRIKSSGLENIRWLLFEEYVDEAGRYLPNEIDKLLSIYESIDRSQDKLRLLLLGNRITNMNPYYDYMGVMPDENSKFTHIKKKSIVLERFISNSVLDYKDKTRFSGLIEGTRYGEFMRGTGTLDDTVAIKALDTSQMTWLINIYTDTGTFGIYANQGELYIGKPVAGQTTLNHSKTYMVGMVSTKSKEYEWDRTLKTYLMQGKIKFIDIKAYTAIVY